MDRRHEQRHSPDPVPDTPASERPAPPPHESRLSQKQKAWLGMAAVGVALVLLTLMPGPEIDPERASAGGRRGWQRAE